MASESKNLSREMILPAYKAADIYVPKGASTIVENPLQIRPVLCKTKPIWQDRK